MENDRGNLSASKDWSIVVTVSPHSQNDRKSLKNLFLLSFDNRDPLAADIAAIGWRVSSARRSEDLRSRFLASNALVALIDVRGNVEGALAAVSEIAALAKDGGIAVLALGDQSIQPEVAHQSYQAGATHFIDIGNPSYNLKPAIDFAYRYVEHMRGGAEATQHFNQLLAESDQEWSFSKTNISQNWVSEALQAKLPHVDFGRYPATGIYRQLDHVERQRVRGAMGRIRDGSAQAAVPHKLAGDNIVHHLHDDGDAIIGRIETFGADRDVDNWADRDLLSGLRNAAAARSWIGERLEISAHIGVIIIGLKNFRTINAAYGRAIGDQVLRMTSQRLLRSITDYVAGESMVARIDGQNFLVATKIGVRDTLLELSETLLDALTASIAIEGRTVRLLARAGLAISQSDSDAVDIIRGANLSLAEAMASDSNMPRISNLSQSQIALEQELEGQLSGAIERGEIAIALQPQIKTQSGQLVGAEALARWDHPQFGMLGAATLFSVADRADLMPMLSAHIHERALAVAAEWPESLSFLRLSINVTAGDLGQKTFIEDIGEKITASGFSAERLTLEITETELIGDMAGSVKKLASLRDRGLRIAIDDFGTGYSSLAYLKELPLDYLKIDSGLTNDISGSAKDQLVVRSIIDLARSLNLEVIAEGVETEAQLQSLTEQGCEYFQGFLRSGPLFPDEFEVFALRSN